MEKDLTPTQYRQRIALSVAASAVVSILILLFFAYQFIGYLPPSENNTVTVAGKVADVYVEMETETANHQIVVTLESGEKLSFVHRGTYRDMVRDIGYDEDELAALLVGKEVELCRLKHCPWIVRLSVDGLVIDHTEPTRASCIEGMLGAVLLALLVLSLPVAATVVYLRKLRGKRPKKQGPPTPKRT